MPERGPLAGVTVVDLTVNIAGPFASLVLADLGARVIKIEPPDGDVARTWPPLVDGTGATFVAFNRGKESVAVDAKQPAGRDVVRRLVATADVFLESLRPGKAAALGLGWEDLQAVNPNLLYCSVNAFGDVGPMASVAGFDAIVQAHSGIMDLTGYPDGDPCRVGAAVIDVGSGMWAALAVLAALRDPDRSRRGGRVQTTMLGTALAFLMHHVTAAGLCGTIPHRLGTAQHNFAPYEAIRAADGLVMVGVNSDPMWRRFCAALDAPDLVDDDRYRTNAGRVDHRATMVSDVEHRTAALTAADLERRLVAAGVPASQVRPVTDLVTDPQVEALGLWGTTADGRTLPRTPVDGAATELGDIPRLGQHTTEVLRDCGMGAAELDDLLRSGILRTAG